jgi:short-subunit dehydrogenase
MIPPPEPGAAALVTGASSGIGAELARGLAARGHALVLVARRRDRLEALAAELRATHGVAALSVPCDLTDPDARGALPAAVAEHGVRVDVLVNNAGLGLAGPFCAHSRAEILQVVRTDFEAVVDLTHLFVPAMVERRRGAVLVVSSLTAFLPISHMAVYAATKAGTLSFAEALSAEVGPHGVTVTALAPGLVETEFSAVADVEGVAARVPGALTMRPDAVAAAALTGLERGRRVVVPGAGPRAASVLGRHLPHAWSLPAGRRAI